MPVPLNMGNLKRSFEEVLKKFWRSFEFLKAA
jgi:hypothetical protein